MAKIKKTNSGREKRGSDNGNSFYWGEKQILRMGEIRELRIRDAVEESKWDVEGRRTRTTGIWEMAENRLAFEGQWRENSDSEIWIRDFGFQLQERCDGGS